MAKAIGTIEVKRQHGKLAVNGLGSTPRGQRYIAETIPLDVDSMTDPKFKKELEKAVEKMFPKKA